MYLKFIKLHVDKLAIGGELRNLTFFRDTVKNAKWLCATAYLGYSKRNQNTQIILDKSIPV